MNVHEWHENIQKSYEKQAYRHHLVLLHEWNECVSFHATLTTQTHGDLGVAVYQEVQQREAEFDADWNFKKLSDEVEYFQLLAIYGDDDDLKRLVIINNGKQQTPDPATWVPYPPKDDTWKEFADDHHTYEMVGRIIRK